jgi:AcrR family transcriptional regulator
MTSEDADSKSRGKAERSTGAKLGRRPGDTDTADKILDAAEEEFAVCGYEGTSLRAICDRAGTNQALIRYYFGSKQGLYTSIYLRRGKQLNRERIRMLDAVETEKGEAITLDDIVAAFILPGINIKREGAGGLAYMRLHARLQDESPEFMEDLRHRVYDDTTQRFIAALKKALPHLDAASIYWRMIFVVGAYFYTVSDSNRLETLSNGQYSSKNLDESYRQMLAFLVGGLSAAATK